MKWSRIWPPDTRVCVARHARENISGKKKRILFASVNQTNIWICNWSIWNNPAKVIGSGPIGKKMIYALEKIWDRQTTAYFVIACEKQWYFFLYGKE